MSLIFGSVAAKHWFPDFREPKDLDYISKENHMTPEVQHYWNGAFEYVLANNKDQKYVDPDFLYTIKVSHAAWDVRWEKTIHDIMFLRRKGCKLDKALYDALYAHWSVFHRQKRINLNVKNEEFFTQYVGRKLDHDWLHGYLAFGAEPMHNRIRKDLGSPLCSEKLWTALSDDDKVKCALEEVYVIATERFIPRGYPPKFAKTKSLKNLITTMTKGWFNLFLIENYETLQKHDNTHWINKLKDLPNG